jgi:hypothetical protein
MLIRISCNHFYNHLMSYISGGARESSRARSAAATSYEVPGPELSLVFADISSVWYIL